jgi:rhodanese-related sulfurtransferase|tara:strand:+ start:6440 stop:6877 length:438 start_codon:yes stop_codon:yes gene_type:complete
MECFEVFSNAKMIFQIGGNLGKSVQNMLDEANQRVAKVEINQAMEWINDGDTVFVDVRSNESIRQSCIIQGAVPAERGMIEFYADQEHSLGKSELKPEKRIVLYCTAGGQAALAGATLLDMGYVNVVNLGSFQAWKDAGGPVEDV